MKITLPHSNNEYLNFSFPKRRFQNDFYKYSKYFVIAKIRKRIWGKDNFWYEVIYHSILRKFFTKENVFEIFCLLGITPLQAYLTVVTHNYCNDYFKDKGDEAKAEGKGMKSIGKLSTQNKVGYEKVSENQLADNLSIKSYSSNPLTDMMNHFFYNFTDKEMKALLQLKAFNEMQFKTFLMYLDGCSGKEGAKNLELSINSYKNYLRRAKEKFRNFLD